MSAVERDARPPRLRLRILSRHPLQVQINFRTRRQITQIAGPPRYVALATWVALGPYPLATRWPRPRRRR